MAVPALLLCNLDDAIDAEYRRRGLPFELEQTTKKSEGIRDSHNRTFAATGSFHRAWIGALQSGDIRKGIHKIRGSTNLFECLRNLFTFD